GPRHRGVLVPRVRQGPDDAGVPDAVQRGRRRLRADDRSGRGLQVTRVAAVHQHEPAARGAAVQRDRGRGPARAVAARRGAQRGRGQALLSPYRTGTLGSPGVRVLVVGSGAREHVLVVTLLADPAVIAVVAAPGNAGIAEQAPCHPLDVTDPAAVAALAVEQQADLVVVGPEAPLVAGAADAVRAAGIACFGPSAQAARLEGSKAFANDVMAAAGVPTAESRVCTSASEVSSALQHFGAPYVVK